MPHDLVATDRVFPDKLTSATNGKVVLEPLKTAWVAMMILGGLVAIVWFATWSGFFVFLGLSAVTLCAGHSVGMHRLLIHRSFKTPIWVEHILVYLGVLVGMAGPFGMIRAHDMRDWHQRQKICPPHPSDQAGLLKDAFWQLCCRFQLETPPEFRIEPATKNDRFYQFLEMTWMGQQLPLAIILFITGRWSWLLWGLFLRVSVSLVGH